MKNQKDLQKKREKLLHESNNDYFSSLENLPTIKTATDNLINEALIRTQNNQRKASSLLGITRQALNKRLLRRAESEIPHNSQ